MSQSDFQDRLNRLQMNRPSPASIHPPNRKAPPLRITRPSKLSWLIALALTFAGSQAAKFANIHYDEIKASYGVEGALLVGCAALALLLLGTLLFLRVLWKQIKGAPLHPSQRDFQEPLNTKDTSEDPNDLPSGRAPNSGKTRPTKRSWLIALALTFAGSQAAKFANIHYDEIKASYGVEGALLVGCAALALLLFGSILFLRAVWKQFKPNTPKRVRRESTQYKASHVYAQPKRTEQKLGPSIFLIVLFPLLYAIAGNLDGLIGEKGQTSHVIFDVVVPSLSTLVLLSFICAGLVVNIGAVFKFGRRESPAITPDMSAEQIDAIAAQRVQRDGLSGILLGAGAVGYLGLGTTAVKASGEAVTSFGFSMLVVAAGLVLSVLIRSLLVLFRQRRFPWRTPIYFLASAAGVFMLFRRTSLHLSDYEPFLASLAN